MNENGNIFVFANQKGGVTKSTSSANLAAALSKKGKKVLYIDMDPQGNGSSIIGFQRSKNENFVSTYDLVVGNSSIKGEHDFVREAKFANLFLIPSSPDLYNADAELAGKFTAVYSLRKIINRYGLNKKYDHIIFDTPPSLGIMTYCALTAADKIVIPIVPDKYAIEGMTQLEKAITEVKENLNSGLELFGVLLARINRNENMSKRIMKKTREYFGSEVVFHTYVRKNVTVEEANAVGKPVIFYNEECSSARDYTKLADEVLTNEASTPKGN